jgi:hypothetical protein
MANKTLAEALLNKTGCYSLIGPARKINLDDSAAFWVTFYHLMFKLNKKAMKRSDIRHYVKELSDLFDEPINYFSADSDSLLGFKKIL